MIAGGGVDRDYSEASPCPHNFVEYPKAGREGKISTLPAQAVTESIMCTLAAPGCQRANKIHSVSPRLSKGTKSPPW